MKSLFPQILTGGSGATIGGFRRCARALPWLGRKFGGGKEGEEQTEAHNAKVEDSRPGSSVCLNGGVPGYFGGNQSNGPAGQRVVVQLQRFPRLQNGESVPKGPTHAPWSLSKFDDTYSVLYIGFCAR